jgi:hypothetical protein
MFVIALTKLFVGGKTIFKTVGGKAAAKALLRTILPRKPADLFTPVHTAP